MQEADDTVASLPDVHPFINEVVDLCMKGILVSPHHDGGILVSAHHNGGILVSAHHNKGILVSAHHDNNSSKCTP